DAVAGADGDGVVAAADVGLGIAVAGNSGRRAVGGGASRRIAIAVDLVESATGVADDHQVAGLRVHRIAVAVNADAVAGADGDGVVAAADVGLGIAVDGNSGRRAVGGGASRRIAIAVDLVESA